MQQVRKKTVWSDEVLDKLLDDLLASGQNKKACAVALAMCSGRRKAELCRFKVDDFKDENLVCGGALYKTSEPIQTKGFGLGKYIYCYTLAKKFKPYFDAWMVERQKLGIECEWLFPAGTTSEQMSDTTLNSWANTFSRMTGEDFYWHIEDVSQASESIISTMKAFGIEAENAISIVDKFNEVGNNFAISSEGVGEALRRSASALAAGNNTLDESIALITAANSVVQDADVVGTTMKTVSMYLRAAKTEAEEAGESTEGMANSVSELREELLALTNGKVDIQIDENTFKSTYQIMKELADVWGELTDITQANILEQIGSKRNANVVSSMLENFNVAEDVVKTAANSAGSALKENEKYLDSINGKIAEFKATFEELSMTLIDSDFVKQVIELGTGLLDVLNVLAKVIDKVGGLNTVLYVTVGILATIKADAIKTFLVTTIPSALAKVTSAVSTFVTGFKQLPAVIKAMNSQTALAIPGTSRLSVALKTLGISASTAQIAVAGIAAAIGAILLIKNAIEDARTKRIEEAASTIASTEATIENADAVKAAYIEYEKYANRTNLTESEEASFKTALDKVTSALGDKAVALEGLTQGTKDYTEALDGAIKKELEEAQLAAKEKRVAAEKKLQSETWSGWDGSKISYNIQDAWTDEEYVKAKEAAQKIASDYLREKVSSVGHGLTATELVLEPVDWNVDHSNMDAVVDYYYIKEMMINLGRSPSGQEYADLMLRQNKILGNMLGADIDFIVRGIDSKTRSVVASRKEAMLRKRQIFYLDTDAAGMYRVYEGRIVQARVIAVAEKVVRVEVFGVETSILARDLAWDWIGDAHERFSVGDEVLVRILSVRRNSLEDLGIKADIKSISENTDRDNLQKCRIQGKYAGRVTDVHKGVVYVRLSNGVNAVAHSCYDYRMPGKKDDVSFAVTRLDMERGVAVGIITRIIRQNL